MQKNSLQNPIHLPPQKGPGPKLRRLRQVEELLKEARRQAV
jgi:hypothetical protein